MAMSALMSEIDDEPEEEPVECRSGASRRATYSEYSPPPRSGARSILLPPPAHREPSAKRPDMLKMTINGIDVSLTSSAQNTLYLFQVSAAANCESA